MESGEPYIMTEKIAAAKPQKSLRAWPWRTRSETRATMAEMATTMVKKASVLVFSLRGAYTMKITTYTSSITAPVPLIVDTSRLLGDTNGSPYLNTRTS